MRIRLSLQLDIRRDRDRRDEPSTDYVPAATLERAEPHPIGFVIPPPARDPDDLKGSRP